MCRSSTILILLVSSCLIGGTGAHRTAFGQAPPASNGQFLQTTWTTETGLPQNTGSALVQTQDGYLWVGTYGGLARFDGMKFTVFDTGNTPGLKRNRILCLYEDRAGNLWIGTDQGGLTRYSEGRFTTFTSKDGLPDDYVLSIAEDREGYLWVGTSNGLARLKDSRFSIYKTRDGLADDYVILLLAGRDGDLWIVTGRGLTRWKSGSFTTYPLPAGFDLKRARTIRQDRDDSIWIASLWGFARFRAGQFTIYRDKGGIAVYANQADEVCFVSSELTGTLTGAFEGEKVINVKGMREMAGTRAIIEDREGNIWIGSAEKGLHRFKPAQVMAYSADNGLSDGSFIVMTEDGAGGMWLGGEGFFHFSAGKFTRYPGPEKVWAALQDRVGRVWVGTYDGLHCLERGRWTNYLQETNPALMGFPVAAIYEDRAGNLWVGTGSDGQLGGLYRFRNGALTPFGRSEGLALTDVRFIAEDRLGALLLGGASGMSRFQDGKFTNYTTEQGLSHDYVRDIHEDADGVLWIGTYGGGLNRFKDGKFTHITTRDGLFDNVVSRILEDAHGNLWMSCNRGIYRTSRKELNDYADGRVSSFTSIAYGATDGMKSSETNGGGQPSGWKDREGKLWFPTLRGVVVIDPNKRSLMPTPVLIEQILAGNTTIDPRPIIELAPGRRDLEIHYTGISLGTPEKVRFKYKLEGYDIDWVDAGPRRIAYYTQIPPGQYRFRVTASNKDGVWNDSAATLEFELLPYFYQTRWFYAFCGLALALTAVGSYRFRVRRLIRRTQKLESKVAARTAEVVKQRNQLQQANEQLGLVNAQLEQANEDLLSTLNELRLGIAIVDREGRMTFLSRSAQGFFGKTHEDVLGHHWEEILPFEEKDRAQLRVNANLPPSQRSKLPVRVYLGREAGGAAGRPFFMEVEVHDDPRGEGHKIFCLYDVSEIYDLRHLLMERANFHDLVGESATMRLVYKQIQDVAQVDATVLVEGETGTGKELVARAIHHAGPRKSKPFIAVNCAGLTESLVASQLFGHKRGAFTGAVSDQVGVFEAAQGGTIFLDEIGDIPPGVQTSLLRVLQEREITRVGESRPRRVDVRVIAATHRDLNVETIAGRFRQDLLYRIRVTKIHLPPLRERREDIPQLVACFLGNYSAACEKPPLEVSQEAMQKLLSYDWPGNVRELMSAIESAVIYCAGPIIQPVDLPAEITGAGRPLRAESHVPDKRQRVIEVLAQTGGNRAAAAKLLGVSRATLYNWLRDLDIK